MESELVILKKRMDDLEEEIKKLFISHNVTIYDLADNKWKLVKPLSIMVEERGIDDFIACLYDIDIYGYGDSLPEAVQELKYQLVSQIEALLEEKERVRLGPVPQRQLDYLTNLVNRKE